MLDSESKNLEEFCEAIEELCKKHGIEACGWVGVMPSKTLIHTKHAYLPSFYVPDDIDKLITKASKKIKLSDDEKKKCLSGCKSLITTFSIMIGMVKKAGPTIQGLVETLEESLGLTKSKIVALKSGIEYIVFTENASYEIIHKGEGMKFSVKMTAGEKLSVPPDYDLAFVGNVQESGTIFGVLGMPMISTGDFMLFTKWPFSGNLDDCFRTAPVIEVIEKNDVN